jgi:LAGLIDADG DNA endonuclease family protein
VTGAVNQQERPGFEQWIVGFVDGEGCFSVPIFRQATARIGWQVQPEFTVVQSAHSVCVLEELRRYFDCGRVGVYGRSDNHRGPMARWAVRSKRDLTERIVPFFEEHPLRTAKAVDFSRFVRVLQLMNAGRHLSVDGMAEIAAIAQEMNFRKPSRFLESSEAIRQPPRLRRSR